MFRVCKSVCVPVEMKSLSAACTHMASFSPEIATHYLKVSHSTEGKSTKTKREKMAKSKKGQEKQGHPIKANSFN